MKFATILALVASASAAAVQVRGDDWNPWEQQTVTVTAYATVTDYEWKTTTVYEWKTSTVTETVTVCTTS